MHIWQARFWRRALSPYSIYRHYPVLHAVRVGLAYLLTVALVLGFDIPHGEWMSITVLIVMGSLPHLGSIFKKARQRAIGTAAGALAGILLIALFIFTGSQFDWRLLPQAGLVAAGYIALRLLCQWLPLVLLARRSGLHGRRTLWLALAQTPMSSGAPGLLLLPWLGSLLLPAGSMALAITVLTLTELAGPSLTQLALRQAGEASD